MKRIAISQPTYLPWYGYFALIDYVDEFVFLNDVQFDKRSWQSRNYIKTSNDKLLLSANVKTKGKFSQNINEVQLINYDIFSTNHLKSIKLNYKKSKYFDLYFNEIKKIFDKRFDKLQDLNIEIINKINELLGIKKKILFSSEFNSNKKNFYKDEYLLEICKKVDAEIYISTIGAKKYLSKSKLFINKNIFIKYFEMNKFVYSQPNGQFVPNLSVLDILFNEGKEALNILRKNFILND